MLTHLAAVVACGIASSTAVGQPDAPQPGATGGPASDPQPSHAPPTESPPSSANAPSAPGYPPGYPAPAPGYPAPYPYPGPGPYPPVYSYPAYPSYPGPTAPPALEHEGPPPAGWHTHDGFFFRFQLGPGAGLLSAGDSSVLYGGFAENIALGWAVSPRIVLFAEMGGVMGVPSDSDQSDIAILATYTLRVSYYSQKNLFFGGGIGCGLMGLGSDEDGRATRSSKMGLGLRFEFGQEYWVSTNWALGWALNLAFAAAADRDTSGAGWAGLAFTPTFSITYN